MEDKNCKLTDVADLLQVMMLFTILGLQAPHDIEWQFNQRVLAKRLERLLHNPYVLTDQRSSPASGTFFTEFDC